MTEKERLELLGLGSSFKNSLVEQYQKLMEEQSRVPLASIAMEVARQKEMEKYRQMALEYEKQYEKYTHTGISKQLAEAMSNIQKLTIPKDNISQYLENALAMNALLPTATYSHSKQTNKASEAKKQMPETKSIKINSIKLNNFRFFTDDEQNNTFEIDGENVLIYGENGSGKSSLFKAFEFLAKKNIEPLEFEENINKFSSNTDTFLEFTFDKTNSDGVNDSVVIDKEHLEASGEYGYVKNISIFKPMLN